MKLYLHTRDFLRIAKRHGLPVRQSGGHIIVTMPDGSPVVLYPRMKDRHLNAQRKRFAEAGLLDDCGSLA